ncbi:ferritin-like domain-containing protein [Allosalinactinospora lopnorensis]|uniref:ferritin-like domain-containing protein n=1 Tax=Allosalinactinospora lopnorensis TaxID=1352348 RepID=UPI000623DCC3|nr:ferritin-like domain-containing protein [Allosalinactinospora lopnorensis]
MSAEESDPEEFTDTGALQNALRAEHAAVYGYGFIGAHSEGDLREHSYHCLDEHRAQRDTLRTELVRLNASPAVSKSAYELPDSTDQSALDAFAAKLEERTARGYLQMAAAEDTSLRDLATRSLQEATVRGLTWGAELSPLPGFPDDEVTELGSTE